MAFKIGEVFRITNRYIEIIHDKDIFSKPISSGNGLHLVGMLNSYVSIPLYNTQQAIGIIFEQLEPSKERDTLFTPKEEYIISKIRLIGTFNPIKNNFKKGIDYFPTLNTDVFTIEEKNLEAIYNSTIKDNTPTLNIGSDIYFPEVKINCDPNILFGKHCAVFGNTGSGKSCTVTSILQGVYCNRERLNNSSEPSLKTIIIDSNDEYSEVFDELGADIVEKQGIDEIFLSHKDLKYFELTQLLKENSPNVLPYLRTAIETLKHSRNVDDPIYYNFSDLAQAVLDAIDASTDARNAGFIRGFCGHLVNRINGFVNDERYNCIFQTAENSIVDFLNSDKKILILSLKTANDVLSIITYQICKSIYFYKVANRTSSNLLLVLEEAHRYISNDGSDLINNYYVDKVAREGRKYGVNILVSTQRPSEVSHTVISQCNSLIVHKITNNRDLEFIRNTIEYEDKSQIDLLTSLKPQQALVLGDAFAFSSLIRIADAVPLPLSETPKIFTPISVEP